MLFYTVVLYCTGTITQVFDSTFLSFIHLDIMMYPPNKTPIPAEMRSATKRVLSSFPISSEIDGIEGGSCGGGVGEEDEGGVEYVPPRFRMCNTIGDINKVSL